MNTRKSATRPSNASLTAGEPAHYDREARRLRAEFFEDSTVRFVIAFDQFMRRIACRVATRLFGSDCMRAPAR